MCWSCPTCGQTAARCAPCCRCWWCRHTTRQRCRGGAVSWEGGGMFVFVRGQDGSSGFRCLCWGEGERLLGGEGWGRCLCVGGGRGRVWARERRRGGGACVCLKRQGAQGQGLCAASVSPFSHHAQLPGSRGNAAVSAISALLLQVWCMGCVCMSRCCLPAQLSHRVCQQVCCQCWSDSVVVDLAVCLVDAWVGHVGGVL